MLALSRTAYLKSMAKFIKFVVCNLSKSFLVVAIFSYLRIFQRPSQGFFPRQLGGAPPPSREKPWGRACGFLLQFWCHCTLGDCYFEISFI